MTLQSRPAVSASLGMLGPPVVWTLHLLLAYFIVTAFREADTLTLRAAIGVLTVVALAAIALVALAADCTARTNNALGMFERRLAWYTGALFFISTLLTAMPAFLLNGFS